MPRHGTGKGHCKPSQEILLRQGSSLEIGTGCAPPQANLGAAKYLAAAGRVKDCLAAACCAHSPTQLCSQGSNPPVSPVRLAMFSAVSHRASPMSATRACSPARGAKQCSARHHTAHQKMSERSGAVLGCGMMHVSGHHQGPPPRCDAGFYKCHRSSQNHAEQLAITDLRALLVHTARQAKVRGHCRRHQQSRRTVPLHARRHETQA